MTLPTSRIRQTTVHVTQIGIGSAPLASAPAWGAGDPIPEAQALQTLDYAYANGIRLIDTAPKYNKGLAEMRVGLFLKSIPRNEVVISTKVGFDISGEINRADFSRDGVLRSLEGSLKRLQTDYVDILHIHDPDDDFDVALNEAYPTLLELRRQGVVKAIGVGMNQWQMLDQFANLGDFDCFIIAGRYTLLEQGAIPLLNHCHKKNIAVFAAGIYNSGILAIGSAGHQTHYNYEPAPPKVIKDVQALEDRCEQFALPLHTAATQFPLRHPAVTTLIVGFQQPSEVQACLDALHQPIPGEFWTHYTPVNF